MENISFFIRVFAGTIFATLFSWLILHFNGKIIIYSFAYVYEKVSSKTKLFTAGNNKWVHNVSELEVLLAGLTPLAIISLLNSYLNTCINSLKLFAFIQIAIAAIFFVIPHNLRKSDDFFGRKFFTDKKSILVLGLIWCAIFSLWATFALPTSGNDNIDPLLVNTNPDMWAYIRRFAGLTTENLSFNGQPACNFILISPKKLSSFIGSIIVSLSPEPAIGIVFFQGLLGCSLFLCLFGEWSSFAQTNKKSLSWQNTLAIIWAISSPQLYWLLVSSYLSNTLFIIILCSALKLVRKISLAGRAQNIEFKFSLVCFIICVFSFYAVSLPIALALYIGTSIIYSWDNNTTPQKIIIQQLKILLTAGITIVLLYIVFNNQFRLEEVQTTINPLSRHGSNFVPLNPWSLLQEKPKPMPVRKDFGVWINILIGLILSSFALWKVWQEFNLIRNKKSIEKTKSINLIHQKDLLAASAGILFYISYLLAYIPLEYTYRLGKIAISVIWPLSIFALLPFARWFGNEVLLNKSKIFKFIFSIFIFIHIILHIDKTLDIQARPSGKYILNSNSDINQVQNITLVRCLNLHESNQYEIMAGLRLAKQYPNININAIAQEIKIPVNEVSAKDSISENNKVIRGFTVTDNKKNLCSFEINF